MSEGLTMSPGLYRQVVQVIRQVLRQWNRQSEPDVNKSRIGSQYKSHAVVLNAELAVASDAFHPSFAVASRLQWKIETVIGTNGPVKVGRYTEQTDTDDQHLLIVWNHSESTAHAANTFGYVRWIDGHWWFFGDCEAMADRNTARTTASEGAITPTTSSGNEGSISV